MGINTGNASDLSKQYEHIARFFSYDFISSLDKESDLYKLFNDDSMRTDNWRKELNDCLELAYRYNLVNLDLEARLKNGDRESWQATMNELRVAKTLEGLFGVDCLLWRPKGRGGKVGEFQITKTCEFIFVEVKTIFPRDLERTEQRIIDKLMRCAEQVPIPCLLSVVIEDAGIIESFSGVKFKEYLKKELTKLDAVKVCVESIKLPPYKEERTGLYLEIETLPLKSKQKEKNCHIGIIGGGVKAVVNDQYVQHSLAKAYTQLPSEQPCLIVVCPSTAFPIDEDDMLNALLGKLAVRFLFRNARLAKTPETVRNPDGFFQPRRNRKASAVGLFNSNTEKPLDIYHNPFAVNPVSESIFMNGSIRQLVKANDTEMKWIGA